VRHGLTKEAQNYQNKKVSMQWLQDQSEIQGNNLNDIGGEVSRYFKNKWTKYF
jgi:hypothetical protein